MPSIAEAPARVCRWPEGGEMEWAMFRPPFSYVIAIAIRLRRAPGTSALEPLVIPSHVSRRFFFFLPA